MTKDTGGPAFPLFAATGYTGMTLRDWIAGLAMQSIIQTYPATSDNDAVRHAYDMADKMLEARK